MAEEGLESPPSFAKNRSLVRDEAKGRGAEIGAVAGSGLAEAYPPVLALMLREFRESTPAGRARLAHLWGIVPDSPAAAALGVPTTDADTTDGTA